MKLGFGMMRLPKTDKKDEKSIDQQQVNKMADLFIQKNTYFDTAYPYHEGYSERSLKKAVVDRYPRDKYTIADKLPLFNITKEEQLEPIFEEQLERTGVEYFDYYLMHNVSVFSEAGFIDVNSFDFAMKKKQEGKIRKLGLSSHADAEYLDNILNQYPEMEFVQLQINYLDWENDAIQSKKCYEVAEKHDKPVIVMEPLKGGFLANVPPEAEKLMRDYNSQSPVEWALRYLAGLKSVEYILIGPSSYEQLKEDIEIFDDIRPLNDEEMQIIKKVVEIINKNITVDCTKCKYCLPACPAGINIPKLFDMYNNDKIEDIEGYTAVGNAYVNFTKDNPKASDCTQCGACIQKCPQHLNIPEYMKDVKTRFEIPLYGFTDDNNRES